MTTDVARLPMLLTDILDVLYRDAAALIDSCSLSERAGVEWIPIQGSLSPDDHDQVEELLDLIRRIEAEGVKPAQEQPAWLIAIVERRRAL